MKLAQLCFFNRYLFFKQYRFLKDLYVLWIYGNIFTSILAFYLHQFYSIPKLLVLKPNFKI